MITQLTTILVMISLLFGGAGATVYAAQDSLPNDALYPVKTVSEDVSLSLAAGQQAKLAKVLMLQNRRVGEVEELVGNGEQVPQQVQVRLETQLNYALKLAASMEGEQMRQALEQIRANNQVLAQVMTMLQVNKPDEAQSTMTQLQEMIRNQNRLVELGLDEPLKFQQMLQTQARVQLNKPVDEEEQVDETPVPDEPTILSGEPISDTQKVGPCETCEPALDGTGPGPGPMNKGEVTQPEEGYGPAAGCETCEPALDGTGPGPGPANKGETSKQGQGASEPVYNGSGPGSGPGPSNQGEITQPEESYGPGPGPQGEVEPPTGPQGDVEPPSGPATQQGGGGK